MATAVYLHDCESCQFLGTGIVVGGGVPDRVVDWYVHGDTVIGRYGHAGREYWSVLRELLPSMAAVGSPFAPKAIEMLKHASAHSRSSTGRAKTPPHTGVMNKRPYWQAGGNT